MSKIIVPVGMLLVGVLWFFAGDILNSTIWLVGSCLAFTILRK